MMTRDGGNAVDLAVHAYWPHVKFSKHVFPSERCHPRAFPDSTATLPAQGEYPSLFCAVLPRQILCFRNVTLPSFITGDFALTITEGESVNCSQVFGGDRGVHEEIHRYLSRGHA